MEIPFFILIFISGAIFAWQSGKTSSLKEERDVALYLLEQQLGDGPATEKLHTINEKLTTSTALVTWGKRSENYWHDQLTQASKDIAIYLD